MKDPIKLDWYRVKLKNRRVHAALGPDGKVWLRWVMLEGKERREMSFQLSQSGAAATAGAINDVLLDAIHDGKADFDR